MTFVGLPSMFVLEACCIVCVMFVRLVNLVTV